VLVTPQFNVRTGIVASASLLLALLLMQTTLFQNLDRQLQDVQARLMAPTFDFSGLLLVDINEDSIGRLEPELGAFPYDRSIYTQVTDWLEQAGVKSITFDIVFGETRSHQGDDEFAATLARYDNIVIGALAVEEAVPRPTGYRRQLDRVAWSVPRQTPAYSWPDATLPRPVFAGVGPGHAKVGVIKVVRDADNVLRRAPLFHRVYDRDLPSLPLASVFADGRPPPVGYDARTGVLSIGRYQWLPGESGSVRMRYPRNTDSIPSVPFYRVVEASLQPGSDPELAALAKGRRIFLGSSAAVLGDYVWTPYGQYPGLYAVALINHMLEQNQLLLPASRWIDALLVLMALLIPVASFQESLQGRPVYNLLSLLAMATFVVGCSSLVLWDQRVTQLLLPLLCGFISFSMLAVLRLFLLYQEKRRLAYEKLAAEQAYQLKSQFISQMTHELRTPLTAIIGFNRLLGESGLMDDVRARYSDVVDRNSHHLITLINNMLDQSKIEAGQIRISRAPASMHEVVEDVVSTLSNIADQKGLKLSAHYGEGIPAALEIDAFRIRQVLVNLVGNALKFTKQGQVDVDVQWSDERLTVAVRDTGAGMAPEAMERIFEPFRQGSDEIQQTYGGTGLGLSICRNLAELMGGTLTVQSSLGAGSTFTFDIPAVRSEERTAAEPVRRIDQAPKLFGRVLLADDNSDIRDLVSRYLRMMGLTVTTAEDGGQALEQALRDRPDVLLMDIEMPVLTGHEVIQRLRGGGYELPILALTAHPEGPEIEAAMAEGCDGFVAKPVNRDRLYSALREVLPAPDGTHATIEAEGTA
jgi:signal transduction histidine kinase/CheY-like chemotaxis protein